MSNERDILIRALEASGSQREAELAKAILPDAPATPLTPPAAAPEAPEQTPGQKYVQGQAAAQAAAGLPEGLMSVAEVQEHERNPPRGLTYAQRMELGDRYIKSCEHHMKEGAL